MSKGKSRNPQALHSWGILLGMAAIPILALMYKLFPTVETVWAVLAVLSCALVLRSAIGFIFPASFKAPDKKPPQTSAQLR